MTDVQVEKAVESDVAVIALEHLRNDEITELIACFSENFRFNDRGIGVEFKNPRRLAEFFRKTRELYADSSLATDKIVVRGEQVVVEWTVRTTLAEPFYGGTSRRVPIVLHGVSIVRTANGRITEWTDYYDGLTARRTALAAYFEEWVEL